MKEISHPATKMSGQRGKLEEKSEDMKEKIWMPTLTRGFDPNFSIKSRVICREHDHVFRWAACQIS